MTFRIGHGYDVHKLVEGRKAEEIISLLEGNTCGMKSTSCPDQLARALKQAIGASLKPRIISQGLQVRSRNCSPCL